MWSLDNFGDKAICLIHDSAVFQWDSAATNATDTRATIIPNAPTASRHMLVSAQLHLVFFGTEETIGTPSSQDDMLIRFSDSEDIENYTQSALTSAGQQRIGDGSQIRGAIRGRDAILVWTDTALFTQRFIGQPLTFAFTQVAKGVSLFELQMMLGHSKSDTTMIYLKTDPDMLMDLVDNKAKLVDDNRIFA